MKLLSHATVLSVALLALGACKSTGTDKASSTVSDLKKLQAELGKGQACIEAAVNAMTALAAEGGNMAAEYEAYSAAVDDVRSQRDRLRSIQERLAERREAFMASWEESLAGIQNASMKERASALAPDQLGVLKDPAAFFRAGLSGSGRALLPPEAETRYFGRMASVPPELLAWLHRE